MIITARFIDDVDIEMDLLKSYISSLEDTIESGIAAYKQKVEKIETDDGIVEVIEGLDDQTYHFETVFEKTFPQIQRSSGLITLCSFFEINIIKICNELKFKNKEIKSLPAKRDIYKAKKYLQETIKIEFGSNDTWKEIIMIQEIRNSFAHHGGKLNDKNYKYVGQFLKDNSTYLTYEEVIILNKGFLDYVINCHESQLKQIIKASKH